MLYEDRNPEKRCVPDFRIRRSRHDGWILVLLGLVKRQGRPVSLIASCFRVSHLPRGHHSFHLADSDARRDLRAADLPKQGHDAVSAPRTNKRGSGKGGFAVLWHAGRAWPALPE